MNKNTLKMLALGGAVAVGLTILKAKKTFKEVREQFNKEIKEAMTRPDKTLSDAKTVLNTEVKPEVLKVVKNLKKKVSKLSKRKVKKSK